MQSLDLLYVVLAFCTLVLTVVITVAVFQLISVLQDVKRMAQNIEQITALAERVARVTFPGLEHLAKGADRMERKVVDFIERKVDKLTK